MYLLFLVVNKNTSFEFSHLGRSSGRSLPMKEAAKYVQGNPADYNFGGLADRSLNRCHRRVASGKFDRLIVGAFFASYFDIVP